MRLKLQIQGQMFGEEQLFWGVANIPTYLQSQFVVWLIPGLQPSLRYRREHLYMDKAVIHTLL